MTNKTERFLVMSEAEFEAAIKAAKVLGYPDLDEAEAACRARPMPNEATHFALFDEDRPYYTPDDHEAWVTKSWRIEK